jgi:hypothetical protein
MLSQLRGPLILYFFRCVLPENYIFTLRQSNIKNGAIKLMSRFSSKNIDYLKLKILEIYEEILKFIV